MGAPPIRRPLVAMCLALALACCHGGTDEDASEAPAPEGEVTFKIVNHGRLDVTIYVVHGSVRERLGTCTASLTAEFAFSMRRLGAGHEYYLLGTPIASTKTARTERLVAADGQVVTWTLEDNLAKSSVEVR